MVVDDESSPAPSSVAEAVAGSSVRLDLSVYDFL